MLKRFLFFVALLLTAAGAASAENRCYTQADALIGNAITWKDIHRVFREFRSCDQGYLATGISDRVVKILAKRWKEISNLGELAAGDEEFFNFVLKHIDATTDWDELCMAAANAKDSCPSDMMLRCEQIAQAALDALPKPAALKRRKFGKKWNGCSLGGTEPKPAEDKRSMRRR